MPELGPHLLGRKPSTPDSRDFTVAMVKDASPVELAFAKLMASSRVAAATKAWAGEVMPFLVPPSPVPDPPPPPPPTTDKTWVLNDPVLDQGNTGHCGGFGGCQWANLEPVDDKYVNSDGHALYYESVAIGGSPGSEDGVESRWVAKALQARGRLSTYAFAKSRAEVGDWIRTKGPVMFGTDWTDDMFNPDAGGFIAPTGAVAGGHFVVLCGDVASQGYFVGLNSWGDSWGDKGFFRILYADFAKLLAGLDPRYPGDAIVSPELAL